MKARKQILLTIPRPAVPLARQTPGESCIWGDCEFHINAPLSQCDAWFVMEGLMGSQATKCPPQNVVFVGEEHHEVKPYHPAFIKQFAKVRSCGQAIEGTHHDYGYLPLPWHAGIQRSNNLCTLTYDDFKNMTPPVKSKAIGTVCSNKKMTQGHVIRSAFVKALKEHMPDQLDAYGALYLNADDKWDAIAPYSYQLVIENGVHEHYWTEKIADAYLGYSFPIYWGCPNLADYFPEDSFARFDAANIQAGIEQVESIMKDGVSKTQFDAMTEARRRVLDQYNMFAHYAAMVEHMDSNTREVVTLHPESKFIQLSALQQMGRLYYFAWDSAVEYLKTLKR